MFGNLGNFCIGCLFLNIFVQGVKFWKLYGGQIALYGDSGIKIKKCLWGIVGVKLKIKKWYLEGRVH